MYVPVTLSLFQFTSDEWCCTASAQIKSADFEPNQPIKCAYRAMINRM